MKARACQKIIGKTGFSKNAIMEKREKHWMNVQSTIKVIYWL